MLNMDDSGEFIDAIRSVYNRSFRLNYTNLSSEECVSAQKTLPIILSIIIVEDEIIFQEGLYYL